MSDPTDRERLERLVAALEVSFGAGCIETSEDDPLERAFEAAQTHLTRTPSPPTLENGMLLECDCCGAHTKASHPNGFTDGDPLDCGCTGHISADEDGAEISTDCDCGGEGRAYPEGLVGEVEEGLAGMDHWEDCDTVIAPSKNLPCDCPEGKTIALLTRILAQLQTRTEGE